MKPWAGAGRNVRTLVVATLVTLGISSTVACRPRPATAVGPTTTPGRSLTALPIDPDRLLPGYYRLEFLDKPGPWKSTTSGHVTTQRIAMMLKLTPDMHFAGLVAFARDEGTGRLLQATRFPTADGKLSISDYLACSTDTVSDNPSELTARAVLTTTIGPLPPYTSSSEHDPRMPVEVRDDGELRVSVFEEHAGMLLGRRVILADHATGAVLDTLTNMSLIYLGPDAVMPTVPPLRCMSRTGP